MIIDVTNIVEACDDGCPFAALKVEAREYKTLDRDRCKRLVEVIIDCEHYGTCKHGWVVFGERLQH